MTRWVLLLLLLCGTPGAWAQEEPEEEGDPGQVAIGERLFLETRFAQFFFANAGGDPNAVARRRRPGRRQRRYTRRPHPGSVRGAGDELP